MHVARIRSGYTDKAGHRREYESAYLRRTWRDGGTVKHETLASLSGLPEQTVALIEAALKGAPLVPAGQAMTITVPQAELDAAGIVTAYKNLKYVERDFRHIKSDDLDLRPVFHRLDKRVKGHVLICMLAAYLVWHLRQAWAPLTYTDPDPPQPDSPVTPAKRSPSAQAKASRQHDEHGRAYLSYQGLLNHLGTLARNELRFAGTPAIVPVLTQPTSRQKQAFDLITAPIPLTLGK